MYFCGPSGPSNPIVKNCFDWKLPHSHKQLKYSYLRSHSISNLVTLWKSFSHMIFYFSEDTYWELCLTGKLHSDKSACPKHWDCLSYYNGRIGKIVLEFLWQTKAWTMVPSCSSLNPVSHAIYSVLNMFHI